jgi:hypothetical protein
MLTGSRRNRYAWSQAVGRSVPTCGTDTVHSAVFWLIVVLLVLAVILKAIDMRQR